MVGELALGAPVWVWPQRDSVCLSFMGTTTKEIKR